jgi:hypothetical protein
VSNSKSDFKTKKGSGSVATIKPKNYNKQLVSWEISERARNAVKHFAEYSERSEESIVGKLIIQELLSDNEFIEWVNKKKNNKRILKELGL